ncbi:hypothetical protein IU447_24180 [Nocardia farcinica]|uniref:hypothetical protein n=1 Tax=Nocardia farcinica TaxID=37329 RepID=UPI001895F614|nr:hypothetical protein [Nocardia farcinica]MBF6363219.1 hypothetical protein [Nocardia farcinica]
MFDPAEHDIAAVLEHLATAGPREIGRVLAAERRGLARDEILARFPASLGGRPTPNMETRNA